MAAPDYFAPLITTLFFVSATLAGIYIYCCFIRTSKKEHDEKISTAKANRDCNEEERNIGILTTNFYNHIYPFSMALPQASDVRVGFPSSPLNTPPVLEEKTAQGLVCPFERKDTKELVHGRPLFCRKTSHDVKWVNSHCNLQVIEEVNEEEVLDEEEAKFDA